LAGAHSRLATWLRLLADDSQMFSDGGENRTSASKLRVDHQPLDHLHLDGLHVGVNNLPTVVTW